MCVVLHSFLQKNLEQEVQVIWKILRHLKTGDKSYLLTPHNARIFCFLRKQLPEMNREIFLIIQVHDKGK